MIKNNLKKGISLIVLVITIIVLAILATTVIINISNSSVMTEARIATFKSDMQNFKSAYSLWLAGYISESGTYDITTINYPAGDQYLLGTVLGGNVPDKYKAGLKVVEGRLVYETDDEEQKEIVNGLDMGTSAYTSKANYAFVHCSKLNDFDYYLDEESGHLEIIPDIEWVEEPAEEYLEADREAYFLEMFCEPGSTIENPTYKSDSELEAYIARVYGYDTFEEFLSVNESTREDFQDEAETYTEALVEEAMSIGEILGYVIDRLVGVEATQSDIEECIAYLYGKESFEDVFPFVFMEYYTFNNLNEFKSMLLTENMSDIFAIKYLIYFYLMTNGYPTDAIYTVTNGTDTYTNCVPYMNDEEPSFIFTAFSGANTITLIAPDGTSITKQVKSSYEIEYNLIGCTLSVNSNRIHEGESYLTTLNANSGYDINVSTVTVTMDGVDITSTTYNNSTHVISIPNVTGNIKLTAKFKYIYPEYADGSWDGTKGVNKPLLGAGMTGIYWDTNGNEVTVTDSNYSNWYDYSSQKWANAKTSDGSYWVWIPRYAYKFESGRYTSTEGTISIKFLQGVTDKDSTGTTISKTYPSWEGATMESYVVHPAFIDDSGDNYMHGGWDEELSGIWVAKYEMSDDESGNLLSIPGVQSSRDSTIGYVYTKCLSYIPELQTHLIKNSEWGAVAYLTHSSFGRNGVEVTKNSDPDFYTGGSQNATANTNPLQSTTGNNTGIFDMSGGASECVAGYIPNGEYTLSNHSSGFAFSTALPTGYQTLSTKYITIYPYDSSNDSNTRNYELYKSLNYGYGDAILEVSTHGWGASWFTDSTIFTCTTFPIFSRGGVYYSEENNGIFNFYSTTGLFGREVSFRTVCVGF